MNKTSKAEMGEGNAPRVTERDFYGNGPKALRTKLAQVTAQRDELLVATKNAYALFSSLLLSEPVEATVDVQSDVLRQLQAAIAKAEGRAQ